MRQHGLFLTVARCEIAKDGEDRKYDFFDLIEDVGKASFTSKFFDVLRESHIFLVLCQHF